MNASAARSLLLAHTVLLGGAGLWFFARPGELGALWPWTLPPLAARFVASLFVGGAACTLLCLRAADPPTRQVLLLLALGDVLIALTGVLEGMMSGYPPAMVGYLVFFDGIAAVLALIALPAFRAADSEDGTLPAGLRAFFLIHLCVVLPVGAMMCFAPAQAQPLWPWKMAPVNVRLIGSFFFGAAFISAWALRQKRSAVLRPTLALYALFTTLATVASLLHFGLFDVHRITTWAFFGLYVFVAAGSWLFWLRMPGETPRVPA